MDNQKTTTVMLVIITLLLFGGGLLFIKNSDRHGSGLNLMDGANASSTIGLPVVIQTVMDQKGELGDLGNSWPGEIISFGDVQIQPRRGGTIIEWNVNIGQKVRSGQVIARLSAPPAMPELTSMLAEQTKMVTESRTDAKAQIDFAKKKKEQLLTLLTAVEKTQTQNISILDGNATVSSTSAAEAIAQSKNAVYTDLQKIKATLEQSINKELQIISWYKSDFVESYKAKNYNTVFFKDSIGQSNRSTISDYLIALANVAKEVIKGGVSLEGVGTEYFQAVSKMITASYPGEGMDNDQLMELRKMVAMDQMTFLEAVKDYRMSKTELVKMENEYRLMLAEKETDYAMQKKEIEEQVAMLDKDIAMNGGRVQAAEASYNTVASSINGGLAIISPSNGIITSIMKKNGDFVEPGMAIASVNNGLNSDKFVRFKIPSNVRLPKSGSELDVIRPGFQNETHKIKLIGVGTALDSSGSYMADAKFIKDISWPVNISVRVMSNSNTSSSLFVNINAIEWNDASAFVWIIKADNTITKRPIKTGRTLGESVEVYEGVALGEKYVGKIIPGLKESVLVREGEVTKPIQKVEDAHGHDD